jgi:hypothetical protein
MTDYIHSTLKWISHNRYQFLSWALVLGVLAFLGCGTLIQPKAPSPSNPKEFVTRLQLDAEVTAFNARAQAAYKLIDLQETVITNILTAASSAAQAIPTPLGPLIGTAIGMFVPMLGRRTDVKRKDAKILELQGKTKKGGK